MRTFEEVWAETGRQYGEEALEQVHMGWEMARAECAKVCRDRARGRGSYGDEARACADAIEKEEL